MAIPTEKTAETVFRRHQATASFEHYAGIVTLHGLVNLAENTGRSDLRELASKLLKPFYTGEVRKVGGIYDRMYRCGGTASALLVKYGMDKAALPALARKADELILEHPRDPHGLFGKIGAPEKIWIDTVFAVCPFLAVLGNLTGRQDYSDEAIHQIRGFTELLLDPQNGLYHQCMNFQGPGSLNEDHWSRGNGWAALALAELIMELPDNTEIIRLYTGLMEACRKVQDEHGLWHQEMTRPDSYTETSGSGLILYAIGRGLERGFLPETYREVFLKGLRGMLGFIALDGSVYHACRSCLAPGRGRIDDYMAWPWVRNDIHAFGPVVLAFGQAIRLGIREIEPAQEQKETL